MFELYYLPMQVEMGEEQPEMSGMLVVLPPRRAQRSRAQDVLSMLVTPFDGLQPPARALGAMLDEAAAQYFNSRGSSTSGLRAAAEHLNFLFLKYNADLQGDRQDGQIFGYLNMAVLRGDQLVLAQVGATAAWLLAPDQVQKFDGEMERGRGLGVSRFAPISYFQTTVKPDSLLIFSATPHPSWTESALTRGPHLTINLLRRRLLNPPDARLRAGIIQFKPAAQLAVHRLRPRGVLSQTGKEDLEMGERGELGQKLAPMPAAPAGKHTPQPVQRDSDKKRKAPGEKATASSHTVPANGKSVTARPVSAGLDEEQNQVSMVVPSVRHKRMPEPDQPVEKPPKLVRSKQEKAKPVRQPKEKSEPDPMRELQRSASRQASRKRWAALWQFWHARTSGLSKAFTAVFARLLPGISEQSPSISGGVMLLISVIIPLLVVTASVTVYFQRGRGQQHQVYLEQALIYAAEARQSQEPDQARNNWLQAVHWLDLAEDYQGSDTSDRLQKEALAALDVMDGVERLDFKALLPFGFSDTLSFVQIAANDTEVYLLESTQGRVLRLFLTGHGYEMDQAFSCAPGSSGTQIIGKLVDLIALPAGNPNRATVLAVDSSGNALYCIPGAEAPLSVYLTPPANGWGEISAISYDQGTLYVLDQVSGAVYTYSGFSSGFGDEIYTYFDPERDENIPDLHNMIDLAAYGEDLYLLNQNGTIAHCTSGIWETQQTRCVDPASFGDLRPDRAAETLVFSDAFFAQVQTSVPPDPSLYLLDINTPAVYRFSLQLNLDRLIEPAAHTDVAVPQAHATAFSVSPTRVVFLAYGSEVIYAPLTK